MPGEPEQVGEKRQRETPCDLCVCVPQHRPSLSCSVVQLEDDLWLLFFVGLLLRIKKSWIDSSKVP